MVRINLLHPKKLSDQHLIAEYVEMLMLVGSIKDDVKEISREDRPETYRLGKGHINFFKNKLLYLKIRHSDIRKEMKDRGFKTEKRLVIKKFDKNLKNDWTATEKDEAIIKRRLLWKLKQKNGWYRELCKIAQSSLREV